MTVTLKRQVKKYVEEQVRTGRFASADDVVAAAVMRMRQDEQFGDFAPGELDALIAEGEKGRGIPAEKVFAEIRQMSREFRKRQQRAKK